MKLIVDIEKEMADFKLAVSFIAETGNTLGLLGASGSGKSLTLRCIAGLTTPTRGRIVLNDRVLFDSDNGINLPCQKRNISFLFQHYALFPHLTVEQNIGFPLRKLDIKERKRRIKENLDFVKLTGLESRYPNQISGGQQQRVALARALVVQPDALLLDEPLSALDQHLRGEMERQLLALLSSFQGFSIYVTHNLEEAYRLCPELVILANGKVNARGSRESIFLHPPTYTAAQLTGCKNLSVARAVSPNFIEAVDWNCRLRVAQALPGNLSHVGIRAHHVVFVDRQEGVNVFPCWLKSKEESPTTVTLYLSLHNQQEERQTYHLLAEVSKEKWMFMKNHVFPWFVHLPPESLFLTTGE
ncbi:sulfate/molybdate ABC transporter ATP-binding protein [Desulfallas sp. Bu1-1]|uniref:sulfate/molybdate ABC transporter ATP-binding protein n=1 Tax=Desulfallas sp. Bu1-1 TaxID=2787620 RepID=UPI00189CBDF2|nr:sulfate/molybdate ABC transporter ATP-binding protein [Desulfallas sp. Bu1-1]MBF7084599.1 sulfate/molybdate ABC transporter ATP-binding protein [Desulfallas sp. Bu1-1]